MSAAHSHASVIPSSPIQAGKRKTRAQHKVMADALSNGASIKSAFLKAGYSPATAKQGRERIPQAVFSEMAEHSKPLIDIGRKLTAEDQENLARGRLAWNATVGKDDAYNSAKLLGQDRRVNMFVSDVQTGVIVIQPPDKLPAISSAAELPPAPVNRPKRLKP